MNKLGELFKKTMYTELEIEIERVYKKLNYQEGWRFLNCYKKNLKSNNGILIITLNPGARKGIDYSKQPQFSSENGCSYLYETWKSKTQGQFNIFLELLHHEINPNSNLNDFINSVLVGYFIPFRSSNFKGLKNRKEAIEFGKKTWSKIIKKNIATIRLVICIDNTTFKTVKEIFKYFNLKEKGNFKLQTGWGNVSAYFSRYESSNKIITLVKVPHLGRFKIFGRTGFEMHINKIILESTNYFNK